MMMMMMLMMMMIMLMMTDDDDDWTEVNGSQLQHTDTVVMVTADDTQDQLVATSSCDQGTMKPSSSSEDSPSVDSSSAGVSTSCSDVCDATPALPSADSDVISAPDDCVVSPSASTDHDSVDSLPSSDQAKSESLVVVAATPERTSPSDDSSNAKGYLL